MPFCKVFIILASAPAMVLGVFIGIWMGAVPGLGGVLVILLLPFTFEMEPVRTLPFCWVFAVPQQVIQYIRNACSAPSLQATILDGYPLAKRGRPPTLGCFTVSAFGVAQ